jgi:hypothetical protein
METPEDRPWIVLPYYIMVNGAPVYYQKWETYTRPAPVPKEKTSWGSISLAFVLGLVTLAILNKSKSDK